MHFKVPLAKLHFMLILVISIETSLYCQTRTSTYPPSSYVAPTFAVDEVSHFSGIKPVFIPVYSIHSGTLSHKISLNYFSSGNRVEDDAGWVGLGFSLQAGGAITRTVRGLPDEKTDGFFNGAPAKAAVMASATLSQNAIDNTIDTHPDLFRYNFDGYTGKMFFDQSGIPHLVPQRNFKILTDPTLSSFQIVTGNGVKYLFTAKELGKVTSQGHHTSLTNYFTTTWFLTSVQSPDNSSLITFDYPSIHTSNRVHVGEEVITKVGWTEFETWEHSYEMEYKTPLIEQINFKNGYLKFELEARIDLPDHFRLKEIKLNYSDNAPYKAFKFQYGYHVYQSSSPQSAAVRKLKLERFWEQSVNEIGRPYQFEYYPQTGSVDNAKLRKSQDKWGYFSGVTQDTRIPRHVNLFMPNPTNDNDVVFIEGSSSVPDLNATKSFMLSALRYPTGGKTAYDYELNQATYDFFSFSKPVVKTGPIELSNTNTTTKSFTVHPETGLSWRGAAATLVISSTCGVYGATACGDNDFSVMTGCPLIELVGPLNKSWSCNYNDAQFSFFIPEGDYQLRVTGNSSKKFSVSLIFYAEDPIVNVTNKPAGGLRMLRVSDYENDADTQPVIRKYLYNDDNNITTGKLNADLEVSRPLNYIDRDETEGEPVPGLSGCYLKTWGVSNTVISKIPMAWGSGTAVGYKRITELHGENGENGKNEYHYISADDYSNNGYLYVNTWGRGLLQKKVTFRKTATGFAKVRELINTYDFLAYPDEKTFAIEGVAVGTVTKYLQGCGVVTSIPRHSYTQYSIRSDWFFLKQIDALDYDSYGNPTTKSTQVQYDYSSLLPVLSIQDTSIPEEKVITRTNFPGNYANLSNSFVSDLKDAHLLEVPIERVVLKQKSPVGGPVTTDVLSATVTTYKRGDNVIPNWVGRVDKVYSLKATNGESVPSSTFAYTNSTAGTLPSNTQSFNLNLTQFSEDLSVVDTDIVYATPVKVLDRTGITSATRIGYGGAFTTASAKNSSVVKYSSFEVSGDDTGWQHTGAVTTQTPGSLAKTGNRFYNLNGGGVTTTLDNTKTYRISFWAKGGVPNVSSASNGNDDTGITDADGWKYYSRVITGAASVTVSTPAGSIFIDELCLVEDGATVQTFTYDPLKGVTSSSDSNGRMVNYFYDELGRVKTIKDEKGAIVEMRKYGQTSMN
jgi:hypothetical protein